MTTIDWMHKSVCRVVLLINPALRHSRPSYDVIFLLHSKPSLISVLGTSSKEGQLSRNNQNKLISRISNYTLSPTSLLYGDLFHPPTDGSRPPCQEGLSESDCPLRLRRGIEVGHAFLLGTKYSEVFNASYQDPTGSKKYVCF